MRRQISVAFQGGGARLVGLIASAHALSDLERSSAIKIKAVSGSSAGSIPAFLLAVDANFDNVRNAIRRLERKIKRRFPRLTKFQIYQRFLRFLLDGSTIYRYSDLEATIDAVLSSSDIDGRKKIADYNLNKDLFITYSDIYSSTFEYAQKGDVITTALARACSLPIIFSSYKNASHGLLIDGGILDNLPTDLLMKNQEEEPSPIFAIGFKPERRKAPNSASSYLYSLAYSGMQYRIAGAKKAVGQDMVLELETRLGTLDFDKMCDIGIDEEYYKIKEQTQSFFKAYLSGLGNFSDPLSESRGLAPFYRLKSVEKSVYNYILNSLKKADCRHEYLKMRVNAFSLANPHAHDEILVEQLIKFPEGDYIKGAILPITDGAGYAASIECRAHLGGPHGPQIECEQILINNNQTEFTRIGGHKNMVVLLFKGDLKPLIGKSVYIIKKQKRYGFMADLRNRGSDYLAVKSYYWPTEEMSIALSVPRGFPHLSCTWLREDSRGSGPISITVPENIVPVDYLCYSAALLKIAPGGRLRGTFEVNQSFPEKTMAPERIVDSAHND